MSNSNFSSREIFLPLVMLGSIFIRETGSKFDKRDRRDGNTRSDKGGFISLSPKHRKNVLKLSRFLIPYSV